TTRAGESARHRLSPRPSPSAGRPWRRRAPGGGSDWSACRCSRCEPARRRSAWGGPPWLGSSTHRRHDSKPAIASQRAAREARTASAPARGRSHILVTPSRRFEWARRRPPRIRRLRLINVGDIERLPSPWRAVVAATAFNAPIGSLYAFSVLLRPLESLLALSRADLALVFALAAAGFGAGMNLAPHVYGLASPARLLLTAAAASTLGIALAATAGGLTQLAIGYGVLFGAGGGAGYILAQQVVNLTVTHHRGLVNGYVAGLFPAGAMIAAPVFGWAVGALGVRATLGGLAAVLAVTGSTSAWLIARAGVALPVAAREVVPREDERRRAVFWRLWLVFFLA